MNRCRKVLLIAAVAMFSCKNTAPLPLKANITSVVDAEGRERIRYEIEGDPGTLIRFKTGAEKEKDNDDDKRKKKDGEKEKEGFIEPNGRLVVIAPVWKGYDFKYQMGIDASKTEKGLFGQYVRSGHLDVVATRKPRILDGHCIVADHKCETEVTVDKFTVNGVEVGTIVAVGASQEKATGESVQVPIDLGLKIPAAILPNADTAKGSDIPKFAITITFPDGAKIQDEVLFPLSKLTEALKAAQPVRALRFGGETATGGTRGLVFINTDNKITIIGPDVTVAELDLVATETVDGKEVSCGTYVDSVGNGVSGTAYTYIRKVSVWERRTGKDIAFREFKPKGSPCHKTATGSGRFSANAGNDLKESQYIIEDWLGSLVKR